MTARIDRRSMLALSAAGALAAALPGCTSRPSQEPYELVDYGYDPSIPEAAPLERPRRFDAVPRAASVRAELLPPVGKQTMPNCFVWATAPFVGGMTRVDVDNPGCHTVWESTVRSAALPHLSIADSLIYTITRIGPDKTTPADIFAFAVIDPAEGNITGIGRIGSGISEAFKAISRLQALCRTSSSRGSSTRACW
ncbi:MAG: hypothetical protein QOH91_3221 [Mycobacterium sp.]|nr:hypothetical protein [Mycobacterium sp.]